MIPKRLETILAVLLLTAMPLMSWTAWLDKSPTHDEVPHLIAGYSIWAGGDHRVADPTHLPQWFFAIPLNFMDVKFVEPDHLLWHLPDEVLLGQMVMYQMGNDATAMIRAGRFMAVLLAAGLGVLVWRCSRSWFGPMGGLVSLTMYAFSPTMLAHGSLTTADAPVAFAMTASTLCLWRVMLRPTWPRIVLSGVVLGVLCLTKASWVLILPVAAVLLIGRLWASRRARRRGGRFTAAAAAHVAIAFAMVWGFYHFRYSAVAEGEPLAHYEVAFQKLSDTPSFPGRMILHARKYRILPESYLYSFAHYVSYTSGRPAYMNGRWTDSAWATFFPYVLLVKTPLPVFALLALALVRQRWRRTWPLWVLLAVYWIAAVTSSINIGHRHILPTYPAMFILAGACVRAPRARWWVVALLAMLVVESVWVRPHYLSYFNLIAGGSNNGYQHLVDSSLDWGQDLPALKDYLDANPPNQGESVYLSYLGTADPRYYGIEFEPLPSYQEIQRPPMEPRPLGAGVYCISATMLQAVYLQYRGPWCVAYEQRYEDTFSAVKAWYNSASDPAARAELLRQYSLKDWRKLFRHFEHLRAGRLFAMLRHRQPDARVNHSILVYRLTLDEVVSAETGPPAELFDESQIEP